MASILVGGKEVFINRESIVTVEKDAPSEGFYTVTLINGDKYKIEKYSFNYYRNNQTSTYTPFNRSIYLDLLDGNEEKAKTELAKNSKL